ncbi:hypothetical protein XELAEV_18007853mg [Xenopus laevis]|uniref:Uncharacterized protein n=1 Tax=Xenopus laevis TaxID=8355 RepID=A0A974I5L7_XENLA|nr:hypothetical protein XELAEV_18007853mg [Xenopus laevis]
MYQFRTVYTVGDPPPRVALEVLLKVFNLGLEPQLLNAAKLLIPLHWKTTYVPTIKDWFNKITEICRFEEMSSHTPDQFTKFSTTWIRWFLFKETDLPFMSCGPDTTPLHPPLSFSPPPP